ncbi:Ff.00g106360.m01.CDS01 [Fusarium sp. VM40]|nr:Ff.00g106360.m01.CDS01 [Fusarium sp. VM40]
MDAGDGQRDSPLSISANVAGILTFVVAIAAAFYARLTYLRNSDDEYFRVKTSLSWYKTESTWLADLVNAINAQHESFHAYQPEYQMYNFVMDDLLNLEKRLLDIVDETEAKASIGDEGKRWTLLPRSWNGRTTAARRFDNEGAVYANEHDLFSTAGAGFENKMAGDEDGRELA